MGYVPYASVSIYPPSIRPFSRRYRIWEYIWDIAPRQYLSIPLSSPKYGIWDMPPTRLYLPIRPFSRRYRIWDIAPCQYLSIPLSSPKYRIWDMSPTRQYLSTRPVSAPSAADIGYGNIYGILPHVSIYLSPFPAPNMEYGICPLRVCIYLSAPSAADIGYGILPHVSIYLSPFPARNIGYGICPLRVSIYLSAPSAADIIWDIAPCQYLSIPLSSPKYRIWDMPPTRQYLSIRPFSRRYRIWDIAPLQRRNIDLLSISIYPSSSAVADIGYGILPHVSIYLSHFPARNIGYGICPDAFRLFWLL